MSTKKSRNNQHKRRYGNANSNGHTGGGHEDGQVIPNAVAIKWNSPLSPDEVVANEVEKHGGSTAFCIHQMLELAVRAHGGWQEGSVMLFTDFGAPKMKGSGLRLVINNRTNVTFTLVPLPSGLHAAQAR